MVRWCALVIGILGLSWQIEGELNKYENYTLMRIFPLSTDEMRTISTFEDPAGEVEMLKKSRAVNDSMDILVPPTRMGFIKDFVTQTKITYEVKQKNYGRTLESDREPKRRVLRPPSFNLFGYNSYDVAQRYLETCRSKHPDLVTLEDVGNTYEGRKMTLVKISLNPGAQNPIIFVDAGIHAREWVAPSLALYLIDRLTSDSEARKVELNKVDWYILPFVNPDGYEYTRSSSNHRMWRKTRSRNGNCFGVDGNRNYGFKWAVSGVSNNPCDMETYAGPKPFSEPETVNVRNIMMENKNRLKLYVSLHSYGQYLVYPWGYTDNVLPRDWRKLDSLARHVSDAVVRAGGSPFKVLSAGNWYPAAGASDDYAFGAVGVPYSYTMELTDGYEFGYPAHLLKKSLPEFYAGFRAFGKQIRSEFGNSPKNAYEDNMSRKIVFSTSPLE